MPLKIILCSLIIVVLLSSCSILQGNKKGCPTNGKNIGAERLLSGEPAAVKAAKKAGKFARN